MKKLKWEIRSNDRAWRGDEAFDRYMLTPHKIELVNGKLLFSKKDRETLLALLLENVGADRVVQIGDPEVWRAAVARLSR
jgi:phosphoglycolate phosphatase-like HAD superfamily hydrolase